MVMPRAANQAVARVRKAAQVAAFSSGRSQAGVVVEGGVQADGTFATRPRVLA